MNRTVAFVLLRYIFIWFSFADDKNIFGPRTASVNVIETYTIDYNEGSNYIWSSSLSTFTMMSNGTQCTIIFDTPGNGIITCSYIDANGNAQSRTIMLTVTEGKLHFLVELGMYQIQNSWFWHTKKKIDFGNIFRVKKTILISCLKQNLLSFFKMRMEKSTSSRIILKIVSLHMFASFSSSCFLYELNWRENFFM